MFQLSPWPLGQGLCGGAIQLLSDPQGDTSFRAGRPLGLPKGFQNKKKILSSFHIIFDKLLQSESILEPNMTDLLLRGGKCVP